MKNYDYPNYPTQEGYLTAQVRQKYIDSAIDRKLLPDNAHRMAHVVSLNAPNSPSTPIQFWQLFSVLGPERLTAVVTAFYQRVYDDEPWFRAVFERISGIDHHIRTQTSMWADAMGGGHYYHGGEYRLGFHHTHNAFELMNDKGAARWVSLMTDTLNTSAAHLTDDPRVRISVNTFLNYFMAKYAAEFNFKEEYLFGESNPPLKVRINLLKMSTEEIENLSEAALKDVLSERGIDVSTLGDKQALVNTALRL